MQIPKAVWTIVAVAPIVGLFALLAWGTFRTNANPGSLAVYDSTGESSEHIPTMPPFTLQLYDGQPFTSESLRGKVVMVDFWAPWCVPCKVEGPGLQRVWEQYRERGDVAFVGVALWAKDSEVSDFQRQTRTSYPLGKDPKGTLGIEFGVTGIPEKYFIAPDGRVLRKIVGPLDETRLKTMLEQLLAGQ